MNRFAILALTLLLSCLINDRALSGASGEVILFAHCSPPRGPGVGYGWRRTLSGSILQSPDDGFEFGEDGFNQVYPTFVRYGSEPSILWSIWGSTVVDGMTKQQVEAISPTTMEKSIIIVDTPDIVSSITASRETTWLYTIFPKLGVGYFTRHKVDLLLDGINELAAGALMVSECTVSNSLE